jgi:hypothetical protein
MKHQGYGAYVNLNTALRVKDGFSGEPVTTGILFELDGVKCEPVEKEHGIFAFTDCADSLLPHVMTITCTGYLDLIIPILPVLESSVLADVVPVIVLHPDASYRYPAGLALVNGRVAAAGNVNVMDIVVAVVIAGRRGATRPGADGRYRFPVSELTASNVTANLEFISKGEILAKRSVLVTNRQSTIVPDVTLTT